MHVMSSLHEVCTLHFVVGVKYGHSDIHQHSNYDIQEMLTSERGQQGSATCETTGLYS